MTLLYKDHSLFLSPQKFPKVLLVEDDPATRWLVRSALKDTCLLSTVTSVDNFMIGIKSINKYISVMPDIVLLDIELSPYNGKDILIDILRADPDAYVIMFSTHNSEENIRDSIEMGAKGFLSKPFSKNQLMDHVYDAVGQKVQRLGKEA